jgi:hypothetical protein
VLLKIPSVYELGGLYSAAQICMDEIVPTQSGEFNPITECDRLCMNSLSFTDYASWSMVKVHFIVKDCIHKGLHFSKNV